MKVGKASYERGIAAMGAFEKPSITIRRDSVDDDLKLWLPDLTAGDKIRSLLCTLVLWPLSAPLPPNPTPKGRAYQCRGR